MNPRYQIIYLNGASSSGKTTLAYALQEKFEKPFLRYSIDQAMAMMPKKLNDWENETITEGFCWKPAQDNHGSIVAYKVNTGPFGKRIVKAFEDIINLLAVSGHYLIIDDVSFGKEQIDARRKSLHKFNVLWVGVTAPLEILEAREIARGDRKIGGCRWQAENVHTNVKYDLMIDTHEKTLTENVEIICKIIQG